MKILIFILKPYIKDKILVLIKLNHRYQLRIDIYVKTKLKRGDNLKIGIR